MKHRLQHIFFLSLAALLCLQSCSLEEPVNNPQGSDGYIELIARPTRYNKYDVATKADLNSIEDAVYNAFLLIFDQSGKRILIKEVLGFDFTTSSSTTIPFDRGLSKITACYLMNVPKAFAENIKGLTKPTDDETALDNEYINTAVLDGITYGSRENFGVPYIDLDGEGGNSAVACIPMFGMEEIDLNSTSKAQITIKRLFAKITVDLKLDMDLNDWNNLVQTYTYLQLNYYELRNMPNRVRLSESTQQSAWVADSNSDAFVTSEISSGTVNKQIYNKSSNTSNNKTCVFEFYVPEYYLNPKSDWTDDEKSKPDNFPEGTKPIHLFLDATYSQYSLTTTDLQYLVYLGRDEISDFSLARNTNYINTLTVKGIDESDLDLRVTTTVINNPVAKEGRSANCYIIGEAGEYYFPAYKGAYNDLATAVLCSNPNAQLLELVNDNDDNIILQDLHYDADRNIISFTVSEIADGNVVIGLVDDKNTETTDDDEIEWSWHLWCSTSSTIDILGWGDMQTQTYPNGTELMDRNLGANPTSLQLATPGVATGLYYRYGNKEPYLNGAYKGGGVLYDDNGDEITPAWSSTKSPTDPCPPGYKVPSPNAFAGNITKEHAMVYGAFRFWDLGNILDTDDIYFPYSGEIVGGSSQKRTTETASRNFSILITSELIYEVGTTAYKFTNIKYPDVVKSNTSYGVLSTTDLTHYQQYLYCSLSFEELLKNATPVTLDYAKGTRKGSWREGYYYEYPEYTEDVAWGSLDWRIQTAYGLLSLGNINFYGACLYGDYSVDSSNGFQVRCVVDTQ